MADRIKEVDKRLARLTESQARALNGLRATRRILVVGGAGTGKTVLAIERARLLAAEGYRVALTCFNRPLGDHLEAVFADKHQAIYRPDWEPPFGAVRFDLDHNVRNTRPIAAVVSRVIDGPLPSEGPKGPPVEFVPIRASDNLAKTIGKTVHHLVRNEAVDPASLVVLTQRKDDRDHLLGTSLAGLPAIPLEENRNGIVVETIHRFKGLESNAAVVVLRQLNTDYDRAVAYIGMSRAKAHLVVLGPHHLQEALRIK